MSASCGDARAGRGTGFDVNEHAGFALVYLAFAYLPLLFDLRAVAAPLLATVVATAAFLPLHFTFYRRGPDGPVLALILATAAIGYALVPFNVGGNTFVIYAIAMAALALRPARAITLAALLLAGLALAFVATIPSLRISLPLSLVMLLVATMVMAGILYSRAHARRNAELRLTQDEVRRLAALAERERIGRDLHDLLGHTLSVVALKSELAGKLIERDPDAARRQIREVEQVARSALSQVREAVTGIRAAGLQAEIAQARLALLAAEVRLDQRLAPVEIGAEAEQTLALAVREAVTNVIRHARAQRVEIELGADSAALRLSISDDGDGGIERSGNGLSGMRERVTALGGSLEIDSPRGSGTRLTLRLPHAGTKESAT